MSLLVLFTAFSIELYEILYNRDIPQQAVLVKPIAKKPVGETHRLPSKNEIRIQEKMQAGSAGSFVPG
jgi:hypothetical protein